VTLASSPHDRHVPTPRTQGVFRDGQLIRGSAARLKQDAIATQTTCHDRSSGGPQVSAGLLGSFRHEGGPEHTARALP